MNEDKRADLHVHSYFSDGSMAPKELVHLSYEKGFSGLSITDHDCFQSFENARLYADELKISIIPGIEISTEYDSEAVHVLGYSFRHKNTPLEEFCIEGKRRRVQRFHEMLEKVSSQGMKVSMEEVEEAFPDVLAYGRPHIAHLLALKGYVRDHKEAFSLYLREGKSCYVHGKKWTTLEAIHAVHAAGGFAVLAHPHLISKGSLLEALLLMPFDGLEAYYASFPMDKDEYFIKKAEKHGKFVTGGSDFHGARRSEIPFGASWTNEETFSMLMKHFQGHGL